MALYKYHQFEVHFAALGTVIPASLLPPCCSLNDHCKKRYHHRGNGEPLSQRIIGNINDFIYGTRYTRVLAYQRQRELH